jgi:hypothetical protein
LQASHNAVTTAALSFTVPQSKVLKNDSDVGRSSLATPANLSCEHCNDQQ